ncbi:MAG: antiterminator LoaP [Defluviitaleaceae bacterium]|nr:antiterminator LoaP [Defluviitaleaceae bacterium]
MDIMFWYVLFVKTGCEQKVVSEIEKIWTVEDMRPFIPTYDAKFRKFGKVILEKHKLFPGYVFIESAITGTEFCKAIHPTIERSKNVLKLLRYSRDYESDVSFQMKSSEKETYSKLYSEDFCIKMSKGIIAGDLIKITDGPLVGHEALIRKVNRHKMQATVEIKLMGSLRNTTIGLEIVEKIL